MRHVLLLTGLLLLSQGSVFGQAEFNFVVEAETIEYDPSDGVGTGEVSIFIAELVTPGFPHNVQGWSMSFTHDPSLIEAMNVEQGAYIADAIMPSFFTPIIHADGVTVSAVYSFLGGVTCTYEVMKEVVIVDYQTVPATLAGDLDGDEVAIEWNSIGAPPVENIIVVGGATLTAAPLPGTITLAPIGLDVEFGRGDCNGDQMLNIADPIFLGEALFITAAPMPCRDACDANDDGAVDIADVVFVPQHIFAGGPPPPAPFGFCGVDPTDDSLECDTPNCP